MVTRPLFDSFAAEFYVTGTNPKEVGVCKNHIY